MTDYSAIDPTLMAWAREKGVHVYTHDRDIEVRSIITYEPSGQQRHLWIGPVDGQGMVGIHAATFDGWKHDRIVLLADFASALTEVYEAMVSRANSTSDV